MQTSNRDYVIETDRLSRSFGRVAVLRDLTLRVPRGGIYGFLGRNGSGKTTAIKILAGLIKPDGGSVRVLGQTPFEFTPEDRQRVGYMSEKQVLPANYKVGGLMAFCSQFYPKWDHGMVVRLLKRFRIDPDAHIRTLSNGTQRQVAFILALAQRPELLILDEPASTLDTVARRELLDEILCLIRESGITVFISSHILPDIERVADHVGILVNGILKVSESLDDLKETIKQVRFHSFSKAMEGFSLPGAFRTQRSGNEMLVTGRFEDEVMIARAAKDFGAHYEITSLPLEDIFVELSRY